MNDNVGSGNETAGGGSPGRPTGATTTTTAAAGNRRPPVLLTSRGPQRPDDPRFRVEPYDFRNPAHLAEAELRRLRVLHEECLRYLAARLSAFLRLDVALKLSRLTTVPYGKWTESIPGPTHLTLFKAEPLVGLGLVDLSPNLGLAIADRMLGGRGQLPPSSSAAVSATASAKENVAAPRPLTEIEISLVEDVLHVVVEEWCAQWHEVTELRGQLAGYETSGRFLQTAPPDTVVLVLTVEVTLGGSAASGGGGGEDAGSSGDPEPTPLPMQIGVPYPMIEPVLKRWQAVRQRDAESAGGGDGVGKGANHGAERKEPPAWRGAYADIALPAVADWHLSEARLLDIVHLRVGDVLELPREAVTETRVRLAGTPVFMGKAGVRDGRVAIQMSRKLAVE